MQGVLGSSLSDVIFFFHFFRFSLIPSQSACLYIIASFEVHLIAENNYPHVLVVLFLKSSTVQYILTPSIFDMTLLYSTNSLKSMTDMPGSSNFRLRGGWGGKTESDRKRLCQLFGPRTYLQGVQLPQHFYSGINSQFQRKLYFLVPKGVQHFPGVGVEHICLFPIELVIFQGESGPPVTPPPPTPPPPPPPPPPNHISWSVHG